MSIAEEAVLGYRYELDELMHKYKVSPVDVEILPLPHKPPPAPNILKMGLAGVLRHLSFPDFIPLNVKKLLAAHEDHLMKVYSYILERADDTTKVLMYASKDVLAWTGESMYDYFTRVFRELTGLG